MIFRVLFFIKKSKFDHRFLGFELSLTLDVCLNRTTKKDEPQAEHERDASYPRAEHERIEADRGRELEWIELLLSGRGRPFVADWERLDRRMRAV